MPATLKPVKIIEKYNMLDLSKPKEPPMKRRAGLWIVQAGRGSYRGIFWKLKHQDEMVLAWEDGFSDILKPRDAIKSRIEDLYFDNSKRMLSSNLSSSLFNGTDGDYLVALAVAEMSRASHVAGKGIVGEAALTGNAQWIYSDSIATDVLSSILIPEYPDEWLLQFAAGVKTILLLPVIPDGVLQLGSVEMVAEDAAFICHVKNEFDTYKETDGYVGRHSIEQFSPISTFRKNLEEPSTNTGENVIEDQSSIYAVRMKDCNLIANQMVPVFMFQDLCNTSESRPVDTLEHVAESEFSHQPVDLIHVAEPFQLSCEEYENNVFKHCNVEKVWASSLCDEFDSSICGYFMNESMDFHFEEGITEPTLTENNFDSAISENGNNLFDSLGDYELHRTLIEDKTYEYTFGSSISGQDAVGQLIGNREPANTMDVHGLGPVGFSGKGVEVGHLLEAAVANAYSNFDDNSSDNSNVTSVNISSVKSFDFSKNCSQSKRSASEYTAPGLDAISKFSASVSVENKISSLHDEQQTRKQYDSLNRGKFSRLSATNKKRARTGDNQKPRPRDRQLIQDRIKELRDLVPNSEKCSIDGLLDKTIKHMLFLRSVSNRADKLRHPTLKEDADEKKTRKTGEVNCSNQNGTSWAVELGSEQQFCPIIVKDLDHPGHMLIEMLCTDHDRFLEIADVIHRLQLTILKGVMEQTTDNSWACFIVQTSGSFHRLDIFWPLMQLLQQSQSPMSSKI